MWEAIVHEAHVSGGGELSVTANWSRDWALETIED